MTNLMNSKHFLDRPRYYSRTWALQALHEDMYYSICPRRRLWILRMPTIHPDRVVLEPREKVKMSR